MPHVNQINFKDDKERLTEETLNNNFDEKAVDDLLSLIREDKLIEASELIQALKSTAGDQQSSTPLVEDNTSTSNNELAEASAGPSRAEGSNKTPSKGNSGFFNTVLNFFESPPVQKLFGDPIFDSLAAVGTPAVSAVGKIIRPYIDTSQLSEEEENELAIADSRQTYLEEQNNKESQYSSAQELSSGKIVDQNTSTTSNTTESTQESASDRAMKKLEDDFIGLIKTTVQQVGGDEAVTVLNNVTEFVKNNIAQPNEGNSEASSSTQSSADSAGSSEVENATVLIEETASSSAGASSSNLGGIFTAFQQVMPEMMKDVQKMVEQVEKDPLQAILNSSPQFLATVSEFCEKYNNLSEISRGQAETPGTGENPAVEATGMVIDEVLE